LRTAHAVFVVGSMPYVPSASHAGDEFEEEGLGGRCALREGTALSVDRTRR
jgi:hypothetical protein